MLLPYRITRFQTLNGILAYTVELVVLERDLPLHTRVAGSGVQVPFGDIPSDVHTAVLFPVGTNPVLHLKIISASPSVLGTATMEPLSGAIGIPQLTERRQ